MQLYSLTFVVAAENIREADKIGQAMAENAECYFDSIFVANAQQVSDSKWFSRVATASLMKDA